MPKKYILEPDGRIRSVEDNSVKEISNEDANINIIKNSAYDTSRPQDFENIDDETITSIGAEEARFGLGDDPSSETSFLSAVETNKSHVFENINSEIEERKSYTPFTNIASPTKSDYASELEILTGFKETAIFSQRAGELNDPTREIVNTTLQMFTYFAKVFLYIQAIEAIVLANRVLKLGAGSDNRIEKYSFSLGRYSITNYDVFSRFLLDTLNYPYTNSTYVERILGFFVGFTAWLAPNSVVDLDQIVKSTSSSRNLLDLFSQDKKEIVFSFEITGAVSVLAENVVSIALDYLLNERHVANRVRLLTRKFKQENYWKNEILSKAKDKDEDSFLTNFNYYFIKFYIERTQVGLNHLRLYYNKESYLKEKRKITINAGQIEEEVFPYNWSTPLMSPTGKAISNESLQQLPQLFHLNSSFLNDIQSFGSKLSIQKNIRQNFHKKRADNVSTGNTQKRIPSDVVKAIEENLESEYMPFYFHDLRTNEIVSFHAFIESISDSFNPEYNSSSGFGRIDDVRTYVKTTRNINLSFTVAAMNPDDHDLMWYQINKIVAMVYPQWSEGFSARPIVNQGNIVGPIPPQKFKYPFSQVPTASPLIRMRVGDVIKNNYSRVNLARIHGNNLATANDIPADEGDPNKSSAPTANYYLRPGLYKLADRTLDLGTYNYNFDSVPKTIRIDHETEIIKNFSINDIKADKFSDREVQTFMFGKTEGNWPTEAARDDAQNAANLKENNITVSNPDFDGDMTYIVRIKNISKEKGYDKIMSNAQLHNEKIGEGGLGTEALVSLGDADDDYLELVVDAAAIIKVADEGLGIADYVALKKSEPYQKLVSGDNNPITKSYESGMSKGLAGFITQLDVNYNDVNWDVSRIGSKAPMLVKITINFAPIHDIPPGLDHQGMLRAPVYNVGRVNNEMFGDPHDGPEHSGSNLLSAVRRSELIANENFSK